MTTLAGIKYSARDLVRAGILTAVVPMAMALAIHGLAPWGCDASAWLCLLPLSLLGVAPIAALGLPILIFFNRRRRQPLPDGWLAVSLFTGCVSQVLASAYGFGSAADHMRRIFLFDVLIFPYGLVAGAMVGVVFWVSLVLPEKVRRLRE